MYRNGEAVADVEGNAHLEIVGPQHLAAYLRTALIATPLASTYRYHVTELLPMGLPIPPVCPSLHPNEAPPTFLPPEDDGHYTVLEEAGVSVRAAAANDEDHDPRYVHLAYALTEPHRRGK